MLLVAKTYWGGAPFNFRRPPQHADVTPLLLDTVDHRQIHGLFWTPENNPVPTVAVVCMHPRVDFTRHYSFPRLLEAGIGCLGANTRNPNNDTDTVHEQIILDVGACIAHLRNLGVERVVLLGNSGGGPLNALYQAQATRSPSERISLTPAGAPTRLESYELSPADGLVYASAHKGEGRIINQCIDPAVLEEDDAFKTDPDLDMYSPDNGFQPAPEWSHYAPEFVERYRAAQIERVERIDDRAKVLARDALAAEELHAEEGFRQLPPAEQRQILLREAFEPGMVITVEPGLYISPDDELAPKKFLGIGIRIEDDILVTADGNDNLTEEQRLRFAERAKQMKLAAEKGERHLGRVHQDRASSAPVPSTD